MPTGSLYIDTPRYLFRAFDSASCGRNDDTVIASAVSAFPELEVDQFDILSLPQEEASERPGKHLWNQPLDAWEPTVLVSWSNSLLFVIQYTIWRSDQRECDPDGVQICAVDTNKFPKGQFARDMWLIHQCYDSSLTPNPLHSLITLRRKTSYHSGEYLSQGTVHHKGRSCNFSTRDLIDAGLCEVYPEFDEAEGRKDGRIEPWPSLEVDISKLDNSGKHTPGHTTRKVMLPGSANARYGFDVLDVPKS